MTQPTFETSKRLTFDTVTSDRKRLLDYLQSSDATNICIDLSHVLHCDSAGLALLMETKRLCQRYNKSFAVEGMPEVIYALAKFCGVEQILREEYVLPV